LRVEAHQLAVTMTSAKLPAFWLKLRLTGREGRGVSNLRKLRFFTYIGTVATAVRGTDEVADNILSKGSQTLGT